MKKLTLAFLLAISTQALWADNWLKNGDFSEGESYWHGDGKSLSDYASDNPGSQALTDAANGLVIPLKPDKWTKVVQDFHGQGGSAVMTITYTVSSDFSFSDDEKEYRNVPNKIDFNAWKAFKIAKGKWLVFISDFGKFRGTYYPMPGPKAGDGAETLTAKIEGLTPHSDKTIALAFPPGTGEIVLLSVSIDDE